MTNLCLTLLAGAAMLRELAAVIEAATKFVKAHRK